MFFNLIDYFYRLTKYLKATPIVIANPKLSKVPIKIYSVSFLSFALERSPNRNTDLAAISKPIAYH
jgi:hypothetical protein